MFPEKCRQDQLTHVKETIAALEKARKNLKTIKFKKLLAMLENGYRIMPGVQPVRYTAMVISFARGATTDEYCL